MIERDAKVASPSYPRDYPFVMSHGRGTEAWDVDGNRFLDFAAGIAVCATGHAHPRVVKAVQEAAGKFLHISSDYWHEEMTALAERLSAIVPIGEPGMCFFCQSGTESVEGALKLARYVTERGRDHRLPRQFPRPHDGLAVADLQQVHAAGGLLRRPCRA